MPIDRTTPTDTYAVADLGAGCFAHPRVALLCDGRTARWAGAVARVRDLVDASLGATRGVGVESAVMLMGGAVLSRLEAPVCDLDVNVRMRFRLPMRAASPEEAQRIVSEQFASFLREFGARAVDAPGVRLLRVRAQWTGAWTERDQRPKGFGVSFGATDLALGAAESSTGEVTVLDAALHAGTMKAMLLVGEGADAVLVDAIFDRWFDAPGGVSDVAVGFGAPWFGKVCFTRAEAERAARDEADLGLLFPSRYSAGTFADTVFAARGVSMVSEHFEVLKVAKLAALRLALRGDAAGVEELSRLIGGPEARAHTLGWRLGAAMNCRRAREADNGVLSACARATLGELAEFAADDRVRGTLPSDAASRESLARLGRVAGPLSPREWRWSARWRRGSVSARRRPRAGGSPARPAVMAAMGPEVRDAVLAAT